MINTEIMRALLPLVSSQYPVYLCAVFCFLAVLGMAVLHRKNFRMFFLNISLPFIFLGAIFIAVGSQSMILRFISNERVVNALLNLLPPLLSAFAGMGYVYVGAGAVCLLLYVIIKFFNAGRSY
jgi:hypothetical protein